MTDQSGALEKFSNRHLDFRLNTERWRQVQTSLDAYFIHTNIGPHDEEEESDLIADLQAAHSTKTAKTHYGRTGVGLDVRSRRDFRHNSGLWHDFYKLIQRRPKSAYTTVEEVKPVEDIETKVNSAMHELYGSDWAWKNPEQRDSVLAIARNDPYVISILPTDAGKTTLILVPALMEPHLTQIVITPYVALADDLKTKCEGLYIDCLRWNLGTRVRASIVVIVVDTAMRGEFTYYLRDLSLQAKLGRIFMDEAHVYLTETNWRWGITKIFDMSLAVPMAFMSATLPPAMEGEFEQRLSLENPTYIRAPCISTRINYSVERVANETPLEERAMELIRTEEKNLVHGQKILVFSPDIQKLKNMSQGLGCGLYTSKDKDKEKSLEDWRGGAYPTLCATSALGAGMDVKDIALVIHVGFMFEIFTFQQGAGRGGRGGKECRSITLIPEGWSGGGLKGPAAKALISYQTATICRQQVLNGYFNGVDDTSITCVDLGSVLCDLCRRREDSLIPSSTESILKRPCSIGEDIESKRSRLMEREEVIREKIRVEAVLEGVVRETFDRLQSDCYYCWIMFRDRTHELSECPFRYPEGAFHGGLEDIMKEWPGLPENHACFKCGLPCDWCEEYVSGGACTKYNVIHPIAEIALMSEDWKTCVALWTEGKSPTRNRERVKWMCERRMVFGKKSTNAFFAFVEVCRKLC